MCLGDEERLHVCVYMFIHIDTNNCVRPAEVCNIAVVVLCVCVGQRVGTATATAAAPATATATHAASVEARRSGSRSGAAARALRRSQCAAASNKWRRPDDTKRVDHFLCAMCDVRCAMCMCVG